MTCTSWLQLLIKNMIKIRRINIQQKKCVFQYKYQDHFVLISEWWRCVSMVMELSSNQLLVFYERYMIIWRKKIGDYACRAKCLLRMALNDISFSYSVSAVYWDFKRWHLHVVWQLTGFILRIFLLQNWQAI